MPKAAIRLILYPPRTAHGQEELARQAADIHAETVIRRLKALRCPPEQKQVFLESIIEAVRKETGDRA
jgi:hypothetical protein